MSQANPIKGKKPEDASLQKPLYICPPPGEGESEGEVSARMSPGMVYVCWAGDWEAFIPAGYTWFVCGAGHHLNYV